MAVKRTSLVLILCMLMLTLTACFNSSNIQSSPQLAIEAFMEAMEESNKDLLIKLTNRKPGNFNLDGIEAVDGYKIHSVTNISEDEAQASVTITMTESSQVYDLQFIFHIHQSEDIWYIQGADIIADWNEWNTE